MLCVPGDGVWGGGPHPPLWPPFPASLYLLPTGALAGAADLNVGATPRPQLRGQAVMAPRGMLGLGPIGGHRTSVSITAWLGKRGVTVTP